MPRDPRALLSDVLDAARAIERFRGDLDLDEYRADDLVRAAVERKLEIVGEALNRLSREEPGLAERIPDMARIIGFRNVLAHQLWQRDRQSVSHGVLREAHVVDALVRGHDAL